MEHDKGLQTLESESDIDSLSIEGEIPDWLTGTLLRTGPAQFEVGDDAYNHWFDGHAMLHGFEFQRGEVSYANRFLETKTHQSAKNKGRIVNAEFGTDPCRSIFKRAMQLFSSSSSTDNANVNIARLADRFVAMTETPIPVTFDHETLETGGHFDYEDDLNGDMTTAHPLYDAGRGALYNYLTEFGRQSTYRIYRQPDGSHTRETVAEIEVDYPRYMHSFGMTENYIVLTETPVVLKPLEILLSSDPIADIMEWEPERGTRFQVIDKRTGEVTGTAKTEPFFTFHHVNAWEEPSNGELVVDLSAYEDASIIENLYLDELRGRHSTQVAGTLCRYRLKPDGSDLRSRQLSGDRLELPRINEEACAARPYRYVWGNGQSQEAGFFDRIVRIDTKRETSKIWSSENCYPGEPVFVTRPGAESEDDGVLLSVVLDGKAERSFVLILDAATLKEVGRANVPHHIPFGFHGNYFPA